MNRPGVISWNLLLGQSDLLKHYFLLYDELWVPWFNSSYPTKQDIEEWDLDREHLASIAYLDREGFIKEPPIDLMGSGSRRDRVAAALINLYNTSLAVKSKVYPTARQAAREGAAADFNMDIAVSRLTSYLMWRDREELVYPVVFPFDAVDRGPKH